MALPPEPIEELLRRAYRGIVAEVLDEVERGPDVEVEVSRMEQGPGPIDPDPWQLVHIRVREVLFGPTEPQELVVYKPENPYRLAPGESGQVMLLAERGPLGRHPHILGLYGPRSYDRERVLHALDARPTGNGPAEMEPVHVRLLRSHWPEIANTEGWSPQFTPGLPATWPPRGRPPRLVWYGFAYGRFNPTSLVDAVEVGSLWGRVVQIGAGASPTYDYELLTRRVEPLGVQGVRPMSAEEISAAEDLPRAEHKLASTRFPRLFRHPFAGPYASWLSTNGVIAARLRPTHGAFLDWIGSRSNARP